MKVLKFGGSSVATADRIRQVVDILKSYHEEGSRFTVVFSAFGGVTDQLQEMSRLAAEGDLAYRDLFQEFCERHYQAAEDLLADVYLEEVRLLWRDSFDLLRNLLYGIYLLREASPRTQDLVMSFGERSSVVVIASFLSQSGVPAEYLDAREIILTDDQFSSALVDFEATNEAIAGRYAMHDKVQVVTGFIASTEDGLTTTLGRGGSDYTAAILAAALEADQIEIWTDVNGVLTADPRKVKRSFTIPSLTYAEAMEMSHFGAKVIYPPTLQPALSKGIPLWIKNTFAPEFEGTYIAETIDSSPFPVKGISSIHEVALITLQGSGMVGVPGTASRLFGALAAAGCNIILITQGSSEHSISFAVAPEDSLRARRAAEEAFEYELNLGLLEPIKVEDELSVVAIIGEEMRYRPGIAGRLFNALGKNGVNVVAIAQGSSELNISVVVHQEDETKALNALHDSFFLSDVKELHLFMVGVGLIGKTLLEQVRQQAEFLRDRKGLDLRLVGLANSRRMAFAEEGIPLDEWKEQLDASGEEMDMGRFLERMQGFNLSSAIFVDCTASGEVAAFYEEILHESIAVVTPNKISTSSGFERYQRLKYLSYRRNVPFLYETNVGAGLPILTTIQDLIDSGDQFLKVEGVLSGSLSFIFNSFKKGSSFSGIVREAQERGYTEPDPREDLSGNDVRRKLLILGREIGLALEASDIHISPILPKACMEAPDVDSFFDELEKADPWFDEMLEKADQEGGALRFIARLDNGEASISLDTVTSENPFYSLSGSDNMVVFTTDRYKDRPLVVRGPGAGAEVTAAGVFAEIIKVGSL
jgi:aspartokinase/homoserine dehydrogenase 1